MAKVIAIAGPPASGKSMLSHALVEKLGPGAFLYALDRDYRSLDHHQRQEPSRINYDTADAIDLEVSRRSIEGLKKQKNEVFLNTYDFAKAARGNKERIMIGSTKTYQRPTGPTIYYPEIRYIVVEGIFALHQKLMPVIDLGIFLDMDIEECFERRLQRDTMEHGLSAHSVHVQWIKTILDGYRDEILPSKERADLVFSDQGELSRLAIPMIFERLGANPGISYEW